MATNSVEICNNALTLIGARRITALNDPSKEGRACNDNYDICRKAVLRMHPWNFAVDRSVITGTTITGVASSGGLIQITAASHGYTTGDLVTVAEVEGTTEANQTAEVTVVSSSIFTLDDSTFTNTYTSGGITAKALLNQYAFKFALPADFIRVYTVKDTSEIALTADEYFIEGLYLLTDFSRVHLRYVKNVTTTTQFDTLFDEAVACHLAHKIAYKITGSETQRDSLAQQLKDVMNRARFVDSVEEPSKQLDLDEWCRSRWGTNQGYVRDPMT